MFSEGVRLLNTGDPEAALQEFQEAVRLAGVACQKADGLYNVAVCHVRLGDIERAVEVIRQALAMDPTLAQEIKSDEDFAPLLSSDVFREALLSAESVIDAGLTDVLGDLFMRPRD